MNVEFPTNIITIEGPDLSGKTTLYQRIHKKTHFRWNIQDRSFLSMLCYARLYDRDEESHRAGLKRELHNLNNRVIVILPPIESLQERLKTRGDDFQDKQSIIKLWEIFSEEADLIQDYSNVLVIRSLHNPEEMADKCIRFIQDTENIDSFGLGKFIRSAVHANYSSATLDLRLIVNKQLDYSDVMNHAIEGSYYNKILKDTCTIIEKEKMGDNPYKIPQTNESRRFYYASNSCISGIHFLVRGNLLTILSTLRSTDVDRNGAIDIKFLCYLSSYIANKLECDINKIELNARLNCAHVRNDLPAWDKLKEKK